MKASIAKAAAYEALDYLRGYFHDARPLEVYDSVVVRDMRDGHAVRLVADRLRGRIVWQPVQEAEHVSPSEGRRL